MKFVSDSLKMATHGVMLGILACLLVFCAGSWVPAGAAQIGLFVGDADAIACIHGLDRIDLPDIDIRIFTEEDMQDPDFAIVAASMDVAVVDVMQRKPSRWLLENRSTLKAGVRIYAVRRSSRGQDFLDAGFRMDPSVRSYYDYTSAENIANLLLFLADRDFGIHTDYLPPIVPPPNALYHPDAPNLFATLAEYASWYRASGHFQEGRLWDLTVVFPTFTVEGKKAALDSLLRAYEKQGINTVTWLREMKDWDKTLQNFIDSPPLAGHLGSITGFAFKFSSMFTVDLLPVLQQANVPVINTQNLFFTSKAQWLDTPQGIASLGMAFQFGNPEISGLVEPTVIGVKEKDPSLNEKINAFRYQPVDAHVDRLARRVSRWHALKQKPNKEKIVFLMYYNHGAGKQNIGASYLNVFRSINRILERLKAEGYTIEGQISEETITDLLVKAGRNIGSWAPDELDSLLAAGNAAHVDMADYRQWLERTPQTFQDSVNAAWGTPEKSRIMTKNGKFIIPFIRLGNLILAPQPVRGFDDDPDKLYHSTTLYPHHQYNAFYYWLQEEIRPDAMISLGTHGTLEWLPGKQAGLTWACPPEVLIGEIPNLYPYIVDDVGEGIQAKRRGRGVIIDHAVPPFTSSGLYQEYATLSALIGEYESASSEPIRAARLERIREQCIQLGLDKTLSLDTVDGDALETIDHYLIALKTEMIPYGLHTFGETPSPAAIAETASAMAKKGDQDETVYAQRIRACGPAEMDSLMRGLSGGYITPAPGNDPLRNPESLPTGRNFYAFDPDKVPSREAWTAGREAAKQLVEAYGKRHEGACPEQVGVILWSVETIRDEGINVATALYLMGMTPIWDHRDKVSAVEPIPAEELGRPRIDVLLQMSGLFRDTFPSVALMLDDAVNQAAVLTDLENFIHKHSQQVARSLMARGVDPDTAKKLSLVRLYSAPPGAYGTKVEKMSGNSGMWEDDDIVAEEGFVRQQSYGYSADRWGEGMIDTYREQLKSVDATVHTISSNLYGTMDNDDMFQYLGGLSMAVRKASGKDPETYVSMQRSVGQGHVEPLAVTLGREIRARYLNPQWIEGMKKENYAGAREMADFMENMWGWQVTTPGSVDKSLWEQSYEVYVEDKYGEDLAEFFNDNNPWAYQSMTARMLESVRKGYWQADETIKQKLAAEYALNVVEKGVACCDHTCNNPMLNKMVVNIISLPGVLSPEMVEKFKLAIEKMAAKPLDQQVAERKQLLAELKESPGRMDQAAEQKGRKAVNEKAQADGPAGAEQVEGYKMEDLDTQDQTTDLTSSGVQWAASVFVFFVIGLFVWGTRRRRVMMDG